LRLLFLRRVLWCVVTHAIVHFNAYQRRANKSILRRNVLPSSTLLPGQFVWLEHVSKDAKKAQEFYGEVPGWKVKPFPMGGVAYQMILTATRGT